MGSEGSEQPASGRDGAGRGDGSGRGSGGQSSDPIGDLQRWLMKAGARSLGRDVADRVRTTINGGKRTSGDVWETATTEPPPDEAPECAWCPICRAARRYRESGGTREAGGAAPASGLGSQIAGVSETLAGLAQDAFGIFDAALRSSQQRPASRPGSAPAPGGAPAPSPATGGGPDSGGVAASGDAPAGWPPPARSAGARLIGGTGWPVASAERAGAGGASDDGPVVGSPVLGGAAVHPQHQDGEAADEGGDRDERGEAGDGPADDGGEDQVERPAE